MKVFNTMLFTTVAIWALNIGEVPKEVTLSGNNGGLVNGKAWSSSSIKGKIYLLSYVDPDKKEENKLFMEALHKKNYNINKFGSIAIINLKATWLPNFAIEKMLKLKQKEYPNKIYIKDKTKYLVKEWDLKDDSSNVILFDKSGKVIYMHQGFMDKSEIDKVFKMIDGLL